MRSAVGKFPSGASDKISDDPCDQNLAGLTLRHHARGRVNPHTADVAIANFDLTRVEADLREISAQRAPPSVAASK